MIGVPEIRRQVAEYLANHIDADRFEDWIVQNTWNIHQYADESLHQLAYAVDAILAEYSSGEIDEQALRRKLIPYAAPAEEGVTSSADPPPRAA